MMCPVSPAAGQWGLSSPHSQQSFCCPWSAPSLYFSELTCSNLSYQWWIRLVFFKLLFDQHILFNKMERNRKYQNTEKIFCRETSVLCVYQLVKSNTVFTLSWVERVWKSWTVWSWSTLAFSLWLWPYAILWSKQVRWSIQGYTVPERTAKTVTSGF